MELRFEYGQIAVLAKRYAEENKDEDIFLEKIRKQVGSQGYLTKDQLAAIGEWKSQRIRKHIAKNDEAFVAEVTKAAFASKHPAFQIEVLTLLKGVGWPTASVILHFFFPEPFPILDFRALYSINCEHIEPKDYNFSFWQEYVSFFRKILKETDVDKRTLDRALWQYSYENHSAFSK
jgi:hypothetical protein